MISGAIVKSLSGKLFTIQIDPKTTTTKVLIEKYCEKQEIIQKLYTFVIVVNNLDMILILLNFFLLCIKANSHIFAVLKLNVVDMKKLSNKNFKKMR